jgi:hypothetical protein
MSKAVTTHTTAPLFDSTLFRGLILGAALQYHCKPAVRLALERDYLKMAAERTKVK